MTASESLELVVELRGLMPRMTDHQAIAVQEMLQPFEDPKRAANALRQYSASHEDFSIAGVRAAIGGSQDGRHAATMQRLAEEQRRDDAIKRQYAIDDTQIGSLDDGELAELKTEAIERMSGPDVDEGVREFYRTLDARKSRALKYEICRMLQLQAVAQ